MRIINKIILHCTATPENRKHDVADVRAWHKQRGWSDIGYHYLIHIDGTIERGRPIGQVGAHTLNHNHDSIGIAYVGGVEADALTPKDTRTSAQKIAIKELLRELRIEYPTATLHGHNEFANKACPSFIVAEDTELMEIFE